MRKKRSFLIVLLSAAIFAGCGDDKAQTQDAREIKSDFSTPEGAILRLEDAYRAQDLDAAVACKDFRTEARLMLEGLGSMPKDQIDNELIAKTAEVLELAYRAEIQNEGFPKMDGVESSFISTVSHQEGIVTVTEVCTYPDGGTSQQKLLVAKTNDGWRVLNVTE